MELSRRQVRAEQPWVRRDGDNAKPYQVRQVRDTMVKYHLGWRMTMDRYEIIIYWSDEDQSFVADVSELPGCMAHGATHEQALANAKEAMQLWIESARADGQPVPAPSGRQLIFA